MSGAVSGGTRGQLFMVVPRPKLCQNLGLNMARFCPFFFLKLPLSH